MDGWKDRRRDRVLWEGLLGCLGTAFRCIAQQPKAGGGLVKGQGRGELDEGRGGSLLFEEWPKMRCGGGGVARVARSSAVRHCELPCQYPGYLCQVV